MGLRDGLALTSNLITHKFEIEMNASMVTTLVNQAFPKTHPYFSLLSNCRWMLTLFPKVRIAHVYRETNMCTDTLAKRKGASVLLFFFLTIPPLFVRHLLANDARGAKAIRLVCDVVT